MKQLLLLLLLIAGNVLIAQKSKPDNITKILSGERVTVLKNGKNKIKGFKVAANEQDSLALVAIYNATDGPNWNNQSGWLYKNVSEWYGVTLNSSGRVIELQSLNNNVTGEIPPEIGNLEMLTNLYITDGNLSKIPKEIGNLSLLYNLELSNCNITSLPKEIGNITTLYYLDLNNNNLTSIPKEVFNNTELVYLILYGNKISDIPDEINKLTKIRTLSIAINPLLTIPPAIFNLTSLKTLVIADLGLTAFPTGIFNLNQLEAVNISENHLSELPDLSVITQLDWCYFNDNNFDFGDFENAGIDFSSLSFVSYTPQNSVPVLVKERDGLIVLKADCGGTGNIYQWYKNSTIITGEQNDSIEISSSELGDIYDCKITNPEYPDLTLTTESYKPDVKIIKKDYDALVALYNETSSDNWTNKDNWLSNQQLSLWHGITVSNGRVVAINLDDNNLEGNIPEKLGDLSELLTLNLNNNKLSGSIPDKFSELFKVTHLGLSGNQLTGVVPGRFALLEHLENLVLFDNNFTELPDLSLLNNLQILSVSNNKLTFEDLEPNVGVALLEFNYYPQQKTGYARNAYADLGTSKEIIVYVGGIYNTYRWFKGGVEISNSNNDTLVISNFSSEDKGTYFCQVTNPLLPDLTIETEPIELIITSFSEIEQTKTIIYPNPISDKLNIKLNDKVGKNIQIQLINLTGKVIYSDRIDKLNYTIDVSSFNAGLYILRIVDDKVVIDDSKVLIIK